MKRVRILMYYLLVATIALVLGFVHGISAAPATPSAIPEKTVSGATDSTKKLEDLKQRLATKVAELRQIERRAMFGSIKQTSLTSLIVETPTKDMKIELTDDIKVIQYLRGKRTVLTLDDIAKGDVVTIFGDYDSTIDLLKAHVIFIQNIPPKRVRGTITAVDSSEFTITLNSADTQSYVIDVEKSTLINKWTNEKGIAKSGFSKLAIGDTVHVVGTSVPKKDNRLSAFRILTIGNISGASPMPTDKEASPAASPTKITSPAPTKKLTTTPTP